MSTFNMEYGGSEVMCSPDLMLPAVFLFLLSVLFYVQLLFPNFQQLQLQQIINSQ